jgi:lysophospholipid acyltransferase (LPLAT)-like uncharacterized protein
VADTLLKLAPPLGAGYLKLVRATSRYREHGIDNLFKAHEGESNAIWCVWHNRLIGAIAEHAWKGMGAVISQSRDGELIARTVERLGYVPLRGSTSRGEAMVLRKVLRHTRDGNDVVFTPDGPRGPRYQVQQGVAYAAMKLGLPVLPLGVGASSKKVFASWDRFQLPLPLGKVQIVYGKPLRFSPDDDIEEVMERIRVAITEATELADELLGVESP